MQHITLHCTGIGLWEVTGHRFEFVTKAALEDPKGPSRGHEDGRAQRGCGLGDLGDLGKTGLSSDRGLGGLIWVIWVIWVV